MFRISICDDDAVFLSKVLNDISNFEINLDIFTYYRGQELLDSEFLYNDIIILDVEMNQINGFETARELRAKGYEGIIIFMTSHCEMVFESFAVKPFDYIVKPYHVHDLKKLFDRATEEINYRRNAFFIATYNSQTYRIPTWDIYYFESQKRNIIIYTKDGQITINGKISEIEIALRNKNFLRCHKGYIINMEHILEFKSNEIKLTNGSKVILSRGYLRLFREAFIIFMKGNKRC